MAWSSMAAGQSPNSPEAMMTPKVLNTADPLDRQLSTLLAATDVHEVEARQFESFAGDAAEVVIVGAGHLGQMALAGAQAASLHVVAIADNNWKNLQGSTSIPVVSPERAVATHGSAAFIVAIYNPTKVRQQLQALGCSRIVPYAAFFWKYWRYMPQEDRLALPHQILKQRSAILDAFDHLADDKSRLEFIGQIAWRCTLDYTSLPSPDDAATMYFADGSFQLSARETLVDCGAFDGDSIRSFLRHVDGRCHRIIAIEPDASNRSALRRYAESLPHDLRERMEIMPFAVGASDQVLTFKASGTAASRISDDGDAEIHCRRLDDVLDGTEPSIIKMDIEGAEPDAIAGARSVIEAHRPILAVCAYHRCEHLWTLPLLLAGIATNYRLHLRRYAEECWETVFYAVPCERSKIGGL
jgi:FkbM family methyltransferase